MEVADLATKEQAPEVPLESRANVAPPPPLDVEDRGAISGALQSFFFSPSVALDILRNQDSRRGIIVRKCGTPFTWSGRAEVHPVTRRSQILAAISLRILE